MGQGIWQVAAGGTPRSGSPVVGLRYSVPHQERGPRDDEADEGGRMRYQWAGLILLVISFMTSIFSTQNNGLVYFVSGGEAGIGVMLLALGGRL